MTLLDDIIKTTKPLDRLISNPKLAKRLNSNEFNILVDAFDVLEELAQQIEEK